MLILSRKCSERIIIGSNIELTVVAIRGGRVQLGVYAPPDVSIHRTKSTVASVPTDDPAEITKRPKSSRED
jgi:carbon storage regulator